MSAAVWGAVVFVVVLVLIVLGWCVAAITDPAKDPSRAASRVATPGPWYGDYHRLAEANGWRGGFFYADDSWGSYNIEGDRRLFRQLGFTPPTMHTPEPDPPGSIFLGDLGPGESKTITLRPGELD